MGFGFAAGHELKEHTAPVDVILHFIDGEAEVTLGDEQKQVRGGTMIHLRKSVASLSTSVDARQDAVADVSWPGMRRSWCCRRDAVPGARLEAPLLYSRDRCLVEQARKA